MLRISLCAMALALSITSAHAVDDWVDGQKFYDPATKQWCCNHVDCSRIEAVEITQTAAGIIINVTGELWPYARVIWASPDKWVRCRYPDGKTRCLIGPPGSS